MTTIEHRVPQRVDPGRINDYGNCVYACRYCNRARGVAPSASSGALLLDPTKDTWGKHFRAVNDCLLPAAQDASAEYTHRAYQLDHPRKVVLRKHRRELLEDRIRALKEFPTVIESLSRGAEAEDVRGDRPSALELLAMRQRLRRHLRRCREDLRHYSAIPIDRDGSCRCDSTHEHCIPEALLAQMLELELSEPPADGTTS